MVDISPRLKRLMQRGTEFLGSELAIVCGAMSWICEHTLVAAVSNGGGFGTLACGPMDPHSLRKEIKATKALTPRPFGVNIIVIHPHLDELIEVCLEEDVRHIILAGGAPPANSVRKIKNGGAKAISFAPALVLAKRLVRMGIDAIIIEGAESGGHIGQVSTSVLAQEILPVVKDVPVIVAGGIGRGEMMLLYLEMGAACVQLGTLFACSSECIAHYAFKEAYIKAAARDALPSPQLDPRFPVIPVRALVNDGTREFVEKQREVIARCDRGELSREEAQLEIENFWAGALRRAVIDGDIEHGSVMAGQIVGIVNSVKPVSVIMEELLEQADAELRKRENM